METNVKMSVANQIKALRGDQSQAEFGAIVGKTQSVISRLEDPDLALIVKVVDYPTFLRSITDYSEESLVPSAYSPNQISGMEEFAPTEEIIPPQSAGDLTSRLIERGNGFYDAP